MSTVWRKCLKFNNQSNVQQRKPLFRLLKAALCVFQLQADFGWSLFLKYKDILLYVKISLTEKADNMTDS